MPADDFDLSTDALDAIAHLTRSANRVRVLAALASGSVTRGELAARTPASRTTVDRIVNEFQDRGWAERATDGTYVATPRGAVLIQRLQPFIESVTALQELEGAIDWLPVETMSIGLEHFSDAEVREPATDPVETVEFMCDLVREASQFRVLSDLVPPEQLEIVITERVEDGHLTIDGVTTDRALGHIGTRPERAARWRRMFEAGSVIAHHEGPLPCNLWIMDETVLIKRSGPEPLDESYGVPIVSRNATVRTWAHETIDKWLANGTPVDRQELRNLEERA